MESPLTQPACNRPLPRHLQVTPYSVIKARMAQEAATGNAVLAGLAAVAVMGAVKLAMGMLTGAA